MTKADMIDITLQKTHIWMKDVESLLGFDNDHAALAALRATLQCLRDHLPTDLVAHLGAQLPTLLRGIYYEGWDPVPVYGQVRVRNDFLGEIRAKLRDHRELGDTEHVVRAILATIAAHITPGETVKVAQALPIEVRRFWPAAVLHQIH